MPFSRFSCYNADMSMSEKEENQICKALPELLLPWYKANKRDLPWRINTDPYRVLVSEIMLQQTRVEAAKDHYIRFMKALPDVHALAECPEEKLMKLWEGLGYYSRAKNLQNAARQIDAAGGFPETPEKLLKLSGVGPYTAGAIASISFSLPVPAVDGNVVRVLSRLFGDERPATDLREEYAEKLAPVYPEGSCGDFTQSLMELGATVCTPRSPKCILCPLLALCPTKSDSLPKTAPKKERKKSDLTVFLFLTPNGVGLCRRKSGVLKGMWQFFNTEREIPEAEIPAFLSELGLKHFEIMPPHSHKHIFTHIEWNMKAYPVRTEEALDFLTYFPREEIGENVALPSAFRWCTAYLNE